MFLRLKWAFYQALQSAITCTLLLLFLGSVFLRSDQPIWYRGAAVCLIGIGVVLMVRFRHFYTMFGIQTVTSTRRGITVEIGHYSQFMDRYRLEWLGDRPFITRREPTQFGDNPIYAMLYENNLLAIVKTERERQQINAVLHDHWPYHPLIEDCDYIHPVMFWSNNSLPFIAEIDEETANA